MSLQAGQRLGFYEIASPIGKGGMGEVYRAHDTKLRRDVAIKVLPQDFSNDQAHLERFQREAQLLASLNHPNIAHVYGFEEFNDTRCIIMELVQGETLERRLTRGRIPLDEALHMASQIAEALETAHEHAIIHRDLKPGNIMVMPEGKIKVLDFGLAKGFETESAGNFSDSPTLGVAATNAGTILGTAAYMSPEQARGRTVDRRTDIFAFGCVLYEMLTSRRAFAGENVTDILSHILQSDPDWTRIPSDAPAAVQRLLRLCLEKDVKRRRQTAADVRIDIEHALAEPRGLLSISDTRRGSPLGWIASLAVAMLVIAALSLVAARHLREAAPAEMRLQILTPSTLTPVEFALSPDGKSIVFVASGDGPQQLWLRSLDKTDAKPILGTDGADYPFWSADNRSIGFFAGGKLYRIDINGGTPQALANAPAGRGGAWNADGTIVFAPTNGPLMRVSASGGDPVAITKLDSPRQTSHRFPSFLPDNRHFLYYAQGNPSVSGIYLASLDGGEAKRLVESGIAGVYLHPGWLLFARQGTLIAQQFDAARGELKGEAVPVTDPVISSEGINLGAFSASADGRIAYRDKIPPMQLSWFDRTGKVLGAATEPDASGIGNPELSPDDKRIAVQRSVQSNTDIWLRDLARSSFIRFTLNPAGEQIPIWSPDGLRITFLSARSGPGNLYVKATGGAADEELLLESPNNKAPQDWSKDGRFLMYLEIDPNRGNDLSVLDLTDKARRPRAVATTAFDERMGQFSPDGRWVTYATNESGRFEIVVQPFPDPSAKWQVSTNGGIAPRWSADGRELYFLAPDGKMMAAPVTASNATFEAGAPQALFTTRLSRQPNSGIVVFRPQYDVSRDGRFLIAQPVEESAASPITLILNWNSEKRK